MARGRAKGPAALVAMAGICLVLTASAEEASFVVAVSRESTIERADADLLRLLYLKDLSDWPDGTAARPIARPAGTPAQVAFREQVLRMERWRLAEHWLSLKQRTGQRRVHAVASHGQTIVLLKRFKGAFAVLPRRIAAADPDLRILIDLAHPAR